MVVHGSRFLRAVFMVNGNWLKEYTIEQRPYKVDGSTFEISGKDIIY
jgi:hypothetical protein